MWVCGHKLGSVERAVPMSWWVDQVGSKLASSWGGGPVLDSQRPGQGDQIGGVPESTPKVASP